MPLKCQQHNVSKGPKEGAIYAMSEKIRRTEQTGKAALTKQVMDKFLPWGEILIGRGIGSRGLCRRRGVGRAVCWGRGVGRAVCRGRSVGRPVCRGRGVGRAMCRGRGVGRPVCRGRGVGRAVVDGVGRAVYRGRAQPAVGGIGFT